MTHPKKVFTTVALLFCGFVMTACPALLKNAQFVKLSDKDGKVIGGIGGFKIHYNAGSTDADDTNKYTDDHYSIVITNTNTGENLDNIPVISDENLAKVNAIGVVSKATDKFVTDEDSAGKYLCDKNIDPNKSSGFGCRVLSSKLGNSKVVYIKLQLKDGTIWKSEDLDLAKATDSTELGDEMGDLIASIGSHEPLQLTLKTCPPDAAGIVIDVTIDRECPAATGKKVEPTPDPNDNTCAPPNFLDTTGKCVSVLQPQKTCDADSVTLLDGTCGTACGLSQVQTQGKCQCLKGYIKDEKGTGCVLDPAQDLTLPPASSSGGGSCSLMRTK